MNPTTANLARLDEWLETLAQETDQVRQSAQFTAYLQAMSRFWRYSRHNSMLIFLQRPQAGYVNSRKRWEELGYRLKRDQWKNGIQILCPHRKRGRNEQTGQDEEVLTHFTTGYIYDETQVEPGPHARPLHAPWTPLAANCGAFFGLLQEVCGRLNITVSERDDLKPALHGYSDGAGHIVLRSQLAVADKTTTLAHELAHEVAHPRRTRGQVSKKDAETQAEAVAYCVCQALGLESANSPVYLALYGVNRDAIAANAAAIAHCVRQIMREVEHVSRQGESNQMAA